MKKSTLIAMLAFLEDDGEVMLECQSPDGHIYVNEIVEVFYDSDNECVVLR